ncbi:hypothetical protein K8R04_01125 [Candidatus Uhrbacteria bacterium]|nr:hypothetical protein [Candidatus Uhrbacteria bacterium]
MQKIQLSVPAMYLLAAALIIVSGVNSVDAVSETLISRAVQMTRIRVNATDVRVLPNVTDPGNSCGGFAKRVVVTTVAPGGEVNSIVTKVRTAFTGTGFGQIGVRAVRAEQGGVVVSNGDIAVPNPDLVDTEYIENRNANTGEVAFYDEADPWDVVAYICGQNASSEPTDISGLAAGAADFYIMMTR